MYGRLLTQLIWGGPSAPPEMRPSHHRYMCDDYVSRKGFADCPRYLLTILAVCDSIHYLLVDRRLCMSPTTTISGVADMCSEFEISYAKAMRAMSRKHEAQLRALAVVARGCASLVGKPQPYMLAGARSEPSYRAARDALLLVHDEEFDALHKRHWEVLDYVRAKHHDLKNPTEEI